MKPELNFTEDRFLFYFQGVPICFPPNLVSVLLISAGNPDNPAGLQKSFMHSEKKAFESLE